MADAIKFTEEELKSLQELQGTYNQITLALGQLNVSKYALEDISICIICWAWSSGLKNKGLQSPSFDLESFG